MPVLRVSTSSRMQSDQTLFWDASRMQALSHRDTSNAIRVFAGIVAAGDKRREGTLLWRFRTELIAARAAPCSGWRGQDLADRLHLSGLIASSEIYEAGLRRPSVELLANIPSSQPGRKLHDDHHCSILTELPPISHHCPKIE
jgi:hypothetical protein